MCLGWRARAQRARAVEEGWTNDASNQQHTVLHACVESRISSTQSSKSLHAPLLSRSIASARPPRSRLPAMFFAKYAVVLALGAGAPLAVSAARSEDNGAAAVEATNFLVSAAVLGKC